MSEITSDSLVYVCGHALRKERGITLIVHHSDGMWQLNCGQTDHHSDPRVADLHPVHYRHLLEQQPELDSIVAVVRRGQLAEMTDGTWKIAHHDD